MLRSMYSGVSGMKGLQVKMDVIANNIANVNTVGFKSSRVNFQDIMSQTTSNASGGGNGLGGQNAQQVGLGVQVGAIDTIHTVGAPQTTGRSMDFYIAGNGYFVLKGAGDDADFYTRDGSFVRDAEGNITNSAGMKVQGITYDYAPAIPPANPNTNKALEYTDDFNFNDPTNPFHSSNFNDRPGNNNNTIDNSVGDLVVPEKIVDPDDPTKTLEFNTMQIDANGLVLASYGEKTYVIGRAAIATFTNPDGLEKTGGNNYQAGANTGDPIIGGSGENGSGMLRSGSLEMSNVDLSMEFTEMIVASRAYQANSRSITTSDEMLQELINLKR